MRPDTQSFGAPGARGWMAALGYAFGAETRRRGIAYVARVEARIDAAGIVRAAVPGSRPEPYQVGFAPAGVDATTALAACGCPMGDAQIPCKHLFAVLCALDLAGVRPDAPAPDRLELTDIDDDDLVPIGELRRIGQRAGGAAARAPAPTWRDRFEPWPVPRPRTGKPARIEYVVCAEPVGRRSGRHRVDHAIADDDRLELALAVRTGKDAQRRRFGVDAGRSLDPIDVELVAALTAVETVADYDPMGYRYGYDYSPTAARRARIAPAHVAAMMARLAATGRLGWLPDGLDRPAPLAQLGWDDGGAWALSVTLAKGATRGRHVARGALIRGDDRIAFEDIAAFAGAGVVIAGGVLRTTSVAGIARWWRLLADGAEVPDDDVAEFLEVTCGHAAPRLDLAAIGWTVDDQPLAPRVLMSLRRGARDFEARAELAYGDRIAAGDEAIEIDVDTRSVVRRDRDGERRAEDALRAAGGRIDRPWPVAAARLRGAIEAIAAAGWDVVLEGRRVRASTPFATMVSTGIDWFDVSIDIGDSAARAPVPELLAAIRAGRPYVKLSDGTTALIPPWLEARRRILAAATPTDDGFRFRTTDALVVASLIDAAPTAAVDDQFAGLRDRLDRVGAVGPRAAPAGFAGTLRDYQAEGLGWLWFLRELGLGGCLADDMGLGKTVQILALLAGTAKGLPSLVVAPRSLVFHWVDEARRFAPQLRTLEWHGGGRDANAAELPRVDLVVTTYATLRRDIERLAAQRYATVILDEAQAIKTASSQTAKACRRLVADHRLALTGTPVENRLEDLASIFDFLNPGLLGQPGVLQAAVAGDTDVELARALGRILRPVLLRRTKDEVLTELPGKTEVVVGCRLEGKDRARYDELRAHYRDALLRRVERDGVGKSAFMVLEALLRLRQAALHPGLLDPTLVDEPSAKLDALLEHLHDALGSGHRALVFSQFTSLLDIVRRRLDREAIGYEYLDGQTRDRRERVASFQHGDAGVFLLSLKAGGTGLNLTAADHVFLLDPWWNPAVEAQAIDRVHRIGQARPVTAYRLVAEDTVEAKILALQDHKRALFAGVFEDKGVVGRLTVDDLRDLLA